MSARKFLGSDPGLIHIRHNEFYQHIETISHPHELLHSPSGIAPPGHSISWISPFRSIRQMKSIELSVYSQLHIRRLSQVLLLRFSTVPHFQSKTQILSRHSPAWSKLRFEHFCECAVSARASGFHEAPPSLALWAPVHRVSPF
jgi:hypothetical protein